MVDQSQREIREAILEQLKPGFESRALKPMPISKRYPLEEAATAYQAVVYGESGGKIVFFCAKVSRAIAILTRGKYFQPQPELESPQQALS
ncbi:MAG TPA: zinc-binding dehydrogenase [Ktedonobacteraceae bacterium]|nr:zinc-binding dehydrogenase [Ktedonobacteraceae bacterium]